MQYVCFERFTFFQVVHSVHGIMFKDLKQILRKEQCDASILLTANVPSTKKIIVHGPQGKMYRFILGVKQIDFKDFFRLLKLLTYTQKWLQKTCILVSINFY